MQLKQRCGYLAHTDGTATAKPGCKIPCISQLWKKEYFCNGFNKSVSKDIYPIKNRNFDQGIPLNIKPLIGSGKTKFCGI